MAKDIVCNMEIDEGRAAAKSEYKGLTYYFCAESCKNSFDAEPDKYIKRLSWWKKFLLKLGDASRKTYGNEPPKCCK